MDNNKITYKESIFELNEINERAKNIKEKIEKEIKKIENSQLEVYNEIISSFKKAHLELDKDEKLLKFDLYKRVKEIKDELEKSLKESDKILSYCEKISQTSENIEEKINNNELKKLYYISEINRKEEKMKNFLKTPIKNLDIYYNKEVDIISYEDYYFSGFPIPKDINYEKKGKQLLLTWNISKLGDEQYDYIINIKTNNEETSHNSSINNFLLDKYETNVEYEVKIRASIDDCFGDWSEIKKFKIEDDSGENKNLFLSSGLFKLNDDDNDNKNNTNPFKNIFSNNNINNKQSNPFSGLFDSVNKENKLFANNNSLFGDNKNENKEKDEKNNIKEGLFTSNNGIQIKSIFGNLNDEKNEKKKIYLKKKMKVHYFLSQTLINE